MVQRKHKTLFIDLFTGKFLVEINLEYKNINNRTFEISFLNQSIINYLHLNLQESNLYITRNITLFPGKL